MTGGDGEQQRGRKEGQGERELSKREGGGRDRRKNVKKNIIDEKKCKKGG